MRLARLAAPPPAALAMTAAPASERLFTYNQESTVLAPGEKELELQATWRQGRRYYYRALDERAEFEFGVTERLQAAFYLNFKSETQAEHDAFGNQTSDTLEHESGVEGVSIELKYKLSDPVADPIGSAVYVEGSANSEEYELELKGIVDKKIASETVALNLTYEY